MPGLINTEFGMNVVCVYMRAYRRSPVNMHTHPMNKHKSQHISGPQNTDRGGPRRPQPAQRAAGGGGVRRHLGRDQGVLVDSIYDGGAWVVF